MNVLIAFLLVMAVLFAALLKLRVSPAVALFACAVLMALLCGFSVSETLSCLTDGFGAAMRSIGLQIVFGGIFGMMLGDSGAMEELAKAVLRKFGRKHDLLALNLASWLIFVPVFFDPAYITLSPLAESLQRFTGKRPGAYVAALFMGILTSHCLIPPAAGPLAVAGQVGDLTASLLKRYSGIKDYGKIFPGHGGVMDRFDSVIFTLIVMYCYTLVL